MSSAVPFTDNFSDLSNTEGFQFEFRCERCGNGFRSAFQRDTIATGQGLLRSVGNLFGGSLEELGNAVSNFTLNRSTNSAAKDKALEKAVQEIAPNFAQCRGCGQWVCRDVCWNAHAGQCVNCAPLVEDELSRLQHDAQQEQIRVKLESTDLVGGMDVAADNRHGCPSCGARTAPGAKFCAECGTPLAVVTHCPSCGNELGPGAKFCAECGTKVA